MTKNSRQERRRARMKASRAANRRGVSSEHRTLAAVEEYLESKGMSVFGYPEKGCFLLDLTFYPPERVTYRDEDGDAACKVIVAGREDGHYFMIASPDAWNLGDCPHRAAVFESLVRRTPDLPLVRFQHDPENDGISPFAIVPIGDRGVSGDSIEEGIARVINGILMWDPVIRRAMETGEVSVPSLPGSGEDLSPDEVTRIGHGLIDRLNAEVKARWQRVRHASVEKAGHDGTVTMPEEPRGDHLTGTAAIVHGGRVLALTQTLLAKFESIAASVNSRFAEFRDC